MDFQSIKHEQATKPILENPFYDRFQLYQNPLYYSMYGYGMPQGDELIRNVLNPLLMQNYMLNQYIATQNMYLRNKYNNVIKEDEKMKEDGIIQNKEKEFSTKVFEGQSCSDDIKFKQTNLNEKKLFKNECPHFEPLFNLDLFNRANVTILVTNMVDFKELTEPLEIEIEEKDFNNPIFYQIYVNLKEKFNSIRKTKEEYSKFLFRKAFKFLKNSFSFEKKGVLKKQLNRSFQQTFFTLDQNKIQGVIKVEKDSALLPFKRNSIVKRVNEKCLKVLFSNANFKSGFRSFFKNFDNFVKEENSKKIEKLVCKIVSLVEKKKVNKIKEIQHLPWLQSWIDCSKSMGENILASINEEIEEN